MSESCTEGLPQPDEPSTACWQLRFVSMLPKLRKYLRYRFSRFNNDEAREEAVQEAVCNACLAYAGMVRRGRAHLACPTSLARYAAAHYWSGRRVGAPLNVNDVCSAYCQRRREVRVHSLVRWNDEGGWREMLLEDRRASPAELAASRIDFGEFMASLGQRMRQIAEMLAIGETTNRCAELLGVTAGRISQIRRELEAAWELFHEPQIEAAAA